MTTEREQLAILGSLLLFRPYQYGVRFIAVSYHTSLIWLLNLAEMTGIQSQWRLRSQEFDYNVEHRHRYKYRATDALLRLRTETSDESESKENTSTLCVKEDDATRLLLRANGSKETMEEYKSVGE